VMSGLGEPLAHRPPGNTTHDREDRPYRDAPNGSARHRRARALLIHHAHHPNRECDAHTDDREAFTHASLCRAECQLSEESADDYRRCPTNSILEEAAAMVRVDQFIVVGKFGLTAFLCGTSCRM